MTCPVSAQYAEPLGRIDVARRISVHITLNGEPFELDQPLSIADLLTKLDIDPRRVAVEHNLAILKRPRFPEVVVSDGDTVEIVNFVGGG